MASESLSLFQDAPDSWDRTTVGEVAENGGGDVQTGPFGSELHAEDYVEQGIPAVMPKNIGNNVISTEDIARITQEDAERLEKYRLKPGDIVYARRGDIEKRALITEDERGWLCGTGCLRIRLDSNTSPSYLTYYLDHPEVRQWIVNHSVGATMRNLNTEILESVPVLLPPDGVQREIANILGTLDDKIDLNREMNRTLESMARAIFKSWFVDFDPVRAKQEGREPDGIDAETAEMFPDRLVDSELGEIPEGWEVRELGDVVSTYGGGTPYTKNPEFWEGGTNYWATPKDLSGHETPILLDTDRKITDAGVDEVTNGERPPGTVLMSKRAPIGYLAIARVPTSINQGFMAIECDGPISNYFLIHWLDENMDRVKSRGNGSTFQEISQRDFKALELCVPPPELVDAFDQQVEPLFDRIESNMKETVVLAETRDTLLPKLLSGELEVSELSDGG